MGEDNCCTNVRKKFRDFVSNITVEPCLLFFSLCQGLYVLVAQDLYIQKVCQVNLNISADICESITKHKAEQLEVQKYVSVLQGYNQVLQAIPAVVYALFAGPWSDKHGRRLLIVFSTFGYVFNNGVFIINVIWFHELTAEYLLFECFQDCTGGYVVFFLACYSYISDISTPEKRTKRLAFADGLFPAGFFTGMALSGHLRGKFGFVACFGLGIVMALLCMGYAIFVLKDSRLLRPKEVQEQLKAMNMDIGNMAAKKNGKTLDADNDEDEGDKTVADKLKTNCVSLFDVNNVKEGFRAVFKKRENNMRMYILMLASSFVLEIFLINGKGPTQYLYFRRKFSWDEKKFGSYIGLFGFVGIFAQYVAVPFLSERIKLHDTTIALIAVSTCMIQQLMVCFTPAGLSYEWIIYLAGVISFLSVTITTVTRALVTKCVGPFEVGKVFSIMAAFQAMVPLAAGPIYANIYKETVKDFPGAFLIFSACLYIVVLILMISVNVGLRKHGIIGLLELLKEDEKEATVPFSSEKLIEKQEVTAPLVSETDGKMTEKRISRFTEEVEVMEKHY